MGGGSLFKLVDIGRLLRGRPGKGDLVGDGKSENAVNRYPSDPFAALRCRGPALNCKVETYTNVYIGPVSKGILSKMFDPPLA